MQKSRLWWSLYEVELTSHTEVTNNSTDLHVDAALNFSIPELASRVQLDWQKPEQLWDSAVLLVTPVLQFNNSVTSKHSENDEHCCLSRNVGRCRVAFVCHSFWASMLLRRVMPDAIPRFHSFFMHMRQTEGVICYMLGDCAELTLSYWNMTLYWIHFILACSRDLIIIG